MESISQFQSSCSMAGSCDVVHFMQGKSQWHLAAMEAGQDLAGVCTLGDHRARRCHISAEDENSFKTVVQPIPMSSISGLAQPAHSNMFCCQNTGKATVPQRLVLIDILEADYC